MKQILKRLELIKTSIEIDDEEIVELQVMKLQKLPIDKAVQEIVEKLQNSEYRLAFQKITEYLKKYNGVAIFIDGELEALKLELKVLESNLQKLSEQKHESLQEIEEFTTLYNIKLGELIGALLKLQEQKLQNEINRKKEQFKDNSQKFNETKEVVEEMEDTLHQLHETLEEMDKDDEGYDEIKTAYEKLQEELETLQEELAKQEEDIKKAKEELDDDPLYDEYEEAKTDYEEFQESYENIKEKHKESFELSKEELQELKILWKKASRLCHPDIVTDELKEQANKIMQQLNEAYSKKDIKAVERIYTSLKNGTIFELSSDKIDDKGILKAKIEELKLTIAETKQELEAIQEDETYKTIQAIDDFDEYFESLQSELEEELQELKNSLEEYKTT